MHLFSDGFDTYSAITELTERWDSGTPGSFIAAANTAFGAGQALNLNTTPIAKTWGSNDATVFLNFRHRQNGGSGTNYTQILLVEGATGQLDFRLRRDGSISVFSGAALLGTAAVGTFAASTWDSWQIKVVINNTAGSVEIRKNGATTPVLSITGANTRQGTANAYVNRISLVANDGGNIGQIDDLFIFSGSGAAPNDWTGDIRCVTQAPSAAVQQQFTGFPVSATWGQLSTAAVSGGPNANTIKFTKVTAPYSGAVSTIVLSLAAAIAGNLNVALYGDNGGAAGSLLAQATAISNPAGGSLTFTLTAPQSVVKGATYWIAIWSNIATNSSFNGSSSGSTVATQSLTYTGTFPSSGVLATNYIIAATTAPYFGANVTGIDNASLVSDTTQDGDATYVETVTAGNADLYSFPTLAAAGLNPLSITGVVPFAIARKSDAGQRIAEIRAKSGATDVAAVSDSQLGASYRFLGGFLGTDPATSAAWTVAGVNGLSVGPKVAA
jgi:hypothetical protein